MKYIIMMQYRSLVNRELMQRAHPAVFETIAEAEAVLIGVCAQNNAMGWLVELEIPAFVPPLKSVG